MCELRQHVSLPSTAVTFLTVTGNTRVAVRPVKESGGDAERKALKQHLHLGLSQTTQKVITKTCNSDFFLSKTDLK